MLYDAEKKQDMLDALNDRVSSIIDICISLSNQGYIPNKNKTIKLSLCSFCIDVFTNIEFFDEEYKDTFENLYNKVLSL